MAQKMEAIDFPITAHDGASAVFKRVEGSLGKLQQGYSKFRAIVGGGIAATLFASMAREAMEAEKQEARLAVTIRATGGAAGVTKDQIEALAEAQKAVTQFDDEAYKAAGATLLKFGNVHRGVFTEAIKLSADWAAFTGGGLEAGAQAIGRALQSPTEGLRILEREMGKIDPVQKRAIENFMQLNELARAQGLILEVLRGRIGGAAEEMNTGWVQAINDVKKSWADMMESIGRSWVGSSAQVAMNGMAFLMGSMSRLFSAETWSKRPFGTPAPSAMESMFLGAAGGGETGKLGPTKEFMEAQDKARVAAKKFADEKAKLIASEAKQFEASQKIFADAQQEEREAEWGAAIKANNDLLKERAEMEWRAHLKRVTMQEENEDAAESLGEAEDERLKNLRDGYIDVIDPAHKYYEELAQVQELLRAGMLDETQAGKLATHYRKLIDQARLAGDEMTEFWKSAARSMQQSMSSFFFDIMQGNLSDLAGSFKRTLDQMVANILAAKAATALFGKDFEKGGDLGGWLGAGIKALGSLGGGISSDAFAAGDVNLGFARGGSFQVGGAGGTDSQMVRFRASPGERVTVTPPGQGGGGTIIMNISTPDAASFRRSEGQITADMARMVGRARRNL